MARTKHGLTLDTDMFGEVARYYDAIMSHVDYDRWVLAALQLSDLLPPGFRHIDVGCGTGTLIKMLRTVGWQSAGVDMSWGMTHTARKHRQPLPVVQADMRRLPFHESVDLITCLFDSLNFLLTPEDVHAAMKSFADALRDGGIVYFDLVTERMVLDHFAGQRWTEDNGHFKTTWDSRYSDQNKLSETHIRVGNGPSCVIYEQIHSDVLIDEALRDAGLSVLGAFDAETWRAPGRSTARIDYVAVKNPQGSLHRPFKKITAAVRRLLA